MPAKLDNLRLFRRGWTVAQRGNEEVRSVNAIVGETNDGFLNDIQARRVRAADAVAIETARGGPVPEGGVGAGTGTVAFGWKGGIGTSSRRSRNCQAAGPSGFWSKRITEAFSQSPESRSASQKLGRIVIATDAPLSNRNLERLARRSFLGIARTGRR